MNYLFQTIVVYDADLAKCKVYEFKLHPGKYQAKLATLDSANKVKEVTFWKEGDKWKVHPPTKDAMYIVEVIAKDIERRKN